MKLDTSAIAELTGELPVYHQYPMQTSPQQAYIELNIETGRVTVHWNGEIGNAVPVSVWHGIGRRYYIPCTLSVAGIQGAVQAINDELQIVLDNSDTVWNGNNHVAEIDDLADEAEKEIDKILSNECHLPRTGA